MGDIKNLSCCSVDWDEINKRLVFNFYNSYYFYEANINLTHLAPVCKTA